MKPGFSVGETPTFSRGNLRHLPFGMRASHIGVTIAMTKLLLLQPLNHTFPYNHGDSCDHFSFATISVLLRKRHPPVLPAGECRHKMTWQIPVPLSFLACRGIVRRFLVRLCKSNNIFLNCQIIRTKNDHEHSAMLLRLRRVPVIFPNAEKDDEGVL